MKIVLNKCYGGFSVSEAVYKEFGIKWDGYGHLYKDADGKEVERTDPRLIAAIEKLGEEASSGCLAKLEIVEIPDDVEWEMDDYDGIETVHELHDSW